jgi:hypothetical protein
MAGADNAHGVERRRKAAWCTTLRRRQPRRLRRRVGALDSVTGARGRALVFRPNHPAALRELFEKYMHYGFEPVLVSQPYRYARDYTTRWLELPMRPS